jgi:squalene-associated FAD-dependent desaturase
VNAARVRPAPGHVVVVGGGLAGCSAALDLADAGRRVTLVERRRHLGGLTWSFEHDGRQLDNGQHVFLRCCTDYLGFLERIGSRRDVVLQDRLDVTAIRPGAGPHGGPKIGRLRRNALPAPLHLAAGLARYPHLTLADRARVGLAVIPLRRLDLDDPALDAETFGGWLARHGQRPAAIEALWDMITVATVNLPAAEASLAMGAKVFQTGVLDDAGAADIGWSAVPLGRLHGERVALALRRAGVTVHLGTRVTAVRASPEGWTVDTDSRSPAGRDPVGGPGEGVGLDADAVVVALPHAAVGAVLPAGTLPDGSAPGDLGTSAIVDVHVVYDRPVTDLALAAGLGTPVQWVFDRTVSSGLEAAPGPGGRQYLAASLSAADDLLGRRPDDIASEMVGELQRMFPRAATARVLDTLVTKERQATFRAVPGSERRRPGPTTAFPGLVLAGAWTDTGWPATMEGAVRSGHAAARVVLARPVVPRCLPEEVA